MRQGSKGTHPTPSAALVWHLLSLQAPGLAVVIVGNRGDSQTYVRMKKKACEEVGIVSFGADLPETATQEEVLKVVSDFNADPRVHGILVQLPVGAAHSHAAQRTQASP